MARCCASSQRDFLEGLLREEAAGRNVRKQSTMTRLAGFPVVKTLDEFNYDFAKGVKRSQIEELAAWVSWSGTRTSCWLAPAA